MADYTDVSITESEKEAIKNNAPDKLPLNPATQGWTGALIRKKTADFVTGDNNSVLNLIETKFNAIQTHMEEDSITCSLDESTVAIDHTLANNSETTYSATATSCAVTIPATAEQGFHASLTFKTGVTSFTVIFTNNSALTLKKLRYREVEVTNYNPSTNKTVTLLFYADGINIYCHINEVD